MAERPILFNAPMVRATLDGRKKQTRRILKPEWLRCLDPEDPEDLVKILAQCPHGVRGDRLWVRETFAKSKGNGHRTVYRADVGTDRWPTSVELTSESRWTPSIHMPRWASRITLDVVSVRVERLKDISAKDAIAEGLLVADTQFGRTYGASEKHLFSPNPRRVFEELWESINGAGSWDANPWVWVVEWSEAEVRRAA